MLILKKPTFAEFMVKNSRFIAEAFPVSSPEEAKELWHAQKQRHANGGHIVYAFITGPQGNIMGCSDDGEPSGTAGQPMLAVLKGSNLTNVIITAARWFGGTKLGTGGLVRAYSDCAKAALEHAECTELVIEENFSISFNYNLYDRIKRLLGESGFEITAENFADKITLTGKIRKENAASLRKNLLDIAGGNLLIY